MAVTQGHGNPRWTEDETILALDLYFDFEGKVPSAMDNSIIALSNLLRSFPFHAAAARKESFRNPDGVAFKLQNLRQIATGKGLGNTSKTDKHIWEAFGHSPAATKSRANLIRSALASIPKDEDESDDGDLTFAEGRAATYAHARRERNPKLRRTLVSQRRTGGKLCCDLCGYKNSLPDSHFDEAALEVHHLRPLASIGESQTKLSDLVLLCAICHRLTHRAIALKKQWLSLDDLRTLLASPPSSAKISA